MDEIKTFIDSLNTIESPYLMASALELKVREVIAEFLVLAFPYCKRGDEDGTWIIPGNRLLRISASHPLLSTAMIKDPAIIQDYVEVLIVVARLENLLAEVKENIPVKNIEETLAMMARIVYGIESQKEEAEDGTFTPLTEGT